MGHKDSHTLAYNHRLLVATQRNISSFILVFSVVLIAWMIFLAAIHNRQSNCQQRAHMVSFPFVLSPSLTYDNILVAINAVFTERRVTLKMDDEHLQTTTVDVMDTPRDLLSQNAFRLLRWREKSWVKWEVRTFATQLCDASQVGVAMDVLPNADYEKAQYRVTSLSFPSLPNTTRQFMLSSQLSSTDATRISTFVELESVFPGFYALSSTNDPVVVQRSYTVNNVGVGEVYFSDIPLDITVRVEEWRSGGAPIFWQLSISSRDLNSQTALASLESSLFKHFQENGMLCQDKACTSADIPFLLNSAK